MIYKYGTAFRIHVRLVDGFVEWCYAHRINEPWHTTRSSLEKFLQNNPGLVPENSCPRRKSHA